MEKCKQTRFRAILVQYFCTGFQILLLFTIQYYEQSFFFTFWVESANTPNYVIVRLILGFTKMLFSCLHNIWIFRETYLTNGRRPPPAVGRRCENCVQLERGGLPGTSQSNLEKIKLKLWRFEISIKWFRARKTKMQNVDASTEKYLKIALVVHQIHSFLWSALS